MIAFLTGQLAEASPTRVVIDCHGVGYEVFIPVSSFAKLPAVGGGVKLLTYHHVNAQDGTQQLFGFATTAEREMFLLLISINGIGPKLGCNILSSAYLNALSDFMGMMLVPSVPSLAIDLCGAVLTSIYMNFGYDRDYVFCVETQFLFEDPGLKLRGHFLLLPDLASLRAIFDAIRLT